MAEFRNKILNFELDDPSADRNFSDRLKDENGWSIEFTQRVIFEYRRFLILLLEAGHPVTPSDEVDQAWHLHLCFTENYWNDFCRDTVGVPLHHGPTKGGAQERMKYQTWYHQTLISYEKLFGEKPPQDIWPPSNIRFGDQSFQRVNTTDFFVLPKRTIWVGAFSFVGLVIGLIIIQFAFSSMEALIFTITFGVIISAFIVGYLLNEQQKRQQKQKRNENHGAGCGAAGGCGGSGCGGDSGCGGGSGCGGSGCGGGGGCGGGS